MIKYLIALLLTSASVFGQLIEPDIYILSGDTTRVIETKTGFIYPKPTDLSFEDDGLRSIDINIPRSSLGDEYWVRPLGQIYGNADGSDYDNAYSGFAVVPTMNQGDIMHIRGIHTENLRTTNLTNDGTETNYITFDFGNDSEIDKGYIDCGESIQRGIYHESVNYIAYNYPRIYDATESCLYIEGTSVGVLTRYGNFSGSGNQGSQLINGSKATYYYCDSYGNADDGFSQHNSSYGEYYYCNSYNNDEGFNVVYSADSKLHGCRFYNNTQYDIWLTASNGPREIICEDYYSIYEKSPQIDINCEYIPSYYGLTAAYNMRPNYDTLNDISANNNYGITIGGTSFIDGWKFDGINDYILTTDFQDLFRGSFTLIFRIKPNDGQPSSDQKIFGVRHTGSEDWVYLDNGSDGKFLFYYESNNNGASLVETQPTYDDGESEWANVVITGDSSSHGVGAFKMYVGGVLRPTIGGDATNIEFKNWTSNRDVYIGAYNSLGTPSGYFKGKIEDIRFYDRVLSETEIKSHHNSYANQAYYRNTFLFEGVGNKPFGMRINSGTFLIAESASASLDLLAGFKYINCSSNGTIQVNLGTTNTDRDAIIYFYDGSWTKHTGSLTTLISGQSWLSLSGENLVFTLTSGQFLGHIIIKNGIVQ